MDLITNIFYDKNKPNFGGGVMMRSSFLRDRVPENINAFNTKHSTIGYAHIDRV